MDINDIILALRILEFLAQRAPWAVELFKSGDAEQLNWDLLKPRTIEELEREAEDEMM